jgi:hypothetical protein
MAIEISQIFKMTYGWVVVGLFIARIRTVFRAYFVTIQGIATVILCCIIFCYFVVVGYATLN